MLNKHHKQCVVLSADKDHGADETLDDHEVRDADEMATEHEQRPRRAVLLEDEDADRSYELHAEDEGGLPETITINEHKHKWRLSPKLIDIIQFLGATSRGLPMPEGNVNTMLHYVKSLQGSWLPRRACTVPVCPAAVTVLWVLPLGTAGYCGYCGYCRS